MQLHSNPFSQIKDIYNPLFLKERFLMSSFALVAIACTFLPVLNPKQDTSVKTLQLGWGFLSSIAFTIASATRKQKERIYKAVSDADAEILKQALKGEFSFEASSQQIDSLRSLAAKVNALPPYERARWVEQYGLQGLVEVPVPMQVELETPSQPSPALSASFNPGQQSSFSDISEGMQTPVDYTWMDAKFINSSKAVFGPKGSGKSVYLAYEAIAFLHHCPDGDLRIGDRHFDEEESQWLPGVPADVLLDKFVAKKSSQILEIFRYTGKILNYRIDNSIRANNPKCVPFKLICDEFEGFLLQISDEEKQEVINIITQSQDEGRKYQVNITLGLHSLKEKRIKIDSSVLFQMDVLCLGQALADTVTRFPSDFEPKQLLQKQSELQRSLGKNQGFACVVRKLGEPPAVAVIPFLDLSKFSFQVDAVEESEPQGTKTSNGDWTEIMTTWLGSLEEKPTPEAVRVKYREITGLDLEGDKLKILMKYLES